LVNTNYFISTGPMITPRIDYSATLLSNGNVLIAGGYDNQNAIVPAAEIYDPALRSFKSAGQMQMPRCGHTATGLSDGRVLIAGGSAFDGLMGDRRPNRFFQPTEFFNPSTGLFSVGPSLHEVRGHHTASLLSDGTILLSGGARMWNGTYTSTSDIYPETERLDINTSVSIPVGNRRGEGQSATTLTDGKVLLVGGGSFFVVHS
jgi:hypothetical protein